MIIKTLVLLISINFSELPNEWQYRDYNQRLESIFQESFKNSGYKLKVFYYAKQNDLWNAVRDSNTAGVFWVSHAGYAQAYNKYTSSFSTVSDEFGYDVSPVFQSINDNIHFLGVIGCSSKKVIEQQKHFPKRSSDQLLKIVSYDQKVEIFQGLTKAISEFKKIEKNVFRRPKICKTISAYPLTVTRTIARNEKNLRHPPVRIETQSGKVLGTLPNAFPGDQQTTTIYLDSDTSQGDFNLYVNAGNNVALRNNEISLGNFEIEGAWDSTSPSTWSVFKNQEGKPLGITRHYYIFKGNLPSKEQVKQYNSCENF